MNAAICACLLMAIVNPPSTASSRHGFSVDKTEPRDQVRDGKIGPMGIAGAVSLGLGAAALVTGGAFIGIGEHSAPEHPVEVRDFRGAGIGLTVAGAALAITGLVLVPLDIRRRNEKRFAFAPSFDVSGFGATALIRF